MANPLEQVANSGAQQAIVTQASAPTMSTELAAKSLSNIVALQRPEAGQQVSIIDGPMTAARSNDTIAMTGSMSLPSGPPPESYVTITLRNSGTTDGIISLFDVDDLHKLACNNCASAAGNTNITAFIGTPSCDSLQAFYNQVRRYRYPVISLIVEDETTGVSASRLGFSIMGKWRNGAGWSHTDVLDTRRQRDLKQIAQDVIYVTPPPKSMFSVLDATGKWDVPVRAGQTMSITFNFGPRAQAI
jgi:hypothetical protein